MKLVVLIALLAVLVFENTSASSGAASAASADPAAASGAAASGSAAVASAAGSAASGAASGEVASGGSTSSTSESEESSGMQTAADQGISDMRDERVGAIVIISIFGILGLFVVVRSNNKKAALASQGEGGHYGSTVA